MTRIKSLTSVSLIDILPLFKHCKANGKLISLMFVISILSTCSHSPIESIQSVHEPDFFGYWFEVGDSTGGALHFSSSEASIFAYGHWPEPCTSNTSGGTTSVCLQPTPLRQNEYRFGDYKAMTYERWNLDGDSLTFVHKDSIGNHFEIYQLYLFLSRDTLLLYWGKDSVETSSKYFRISSIDSIRSNQKIP